MHFQIFARLLSVHSTVVAATVRTSQSEPHAKPLHSCWRQHSVIHDIL